MVGNGIDVGKGFGDGGKLLGRHFNTSLSKAFEEDVDQFLAVNACFDVHDAVQTRHLAEEAFQIKRRPLVGDALKSRTFFQPGNGFGINGFVNRGCSSCRPTKALQAITRVNDLKRHRSVMITFEFNSAIRVLFHVHENKRGQFQTPHDDFHGSPGISSTAPRILNIGDFGGIDAKCLGQHTVAMFHTFFHPINFKAVFWPIEHVMSHHFKGGQMAA